MILEKLFKSVFGDPQLAAMKPFNSLVDKINELEPSYKSLSDDELKLKTSYFKEQLQKGTSLDDLLCDAFATVREAASRVLGMRHFDVQLIGGIILHQGNIAEMRTGEGKTLMSTLPAYLNALTNQGVYVVTVNDYLARRDSEWMGQIFTFLGLSVGLIQSGMESQERLVAYECDITYGTNNEFGFDYLRDNLVGRVEDCCQSRRHFAIIDEVDSILIDEARTPLIISGPVKDSTEKYSNIASVTKKLKKDVHFTVEEKQKNIILTDEGINEIESALNLPDIFSVKNMDAAHMTIQCLKALYLFNKDVDYVVKEGQVVIVDEFTGRLMEGRRYSDGLHQAIEAIEGLSIKNESQTLASVTFQNYFRMFPKLAGMTGTAITEEGEFDKIYNLSVFVVPTNKPMVRQDLSDVIYKTKKEKYNAIINQIIDSHEKGQPVLVGTIAIETSEYLSRLLTSKGIKHHVLNAKQHAQEADIIANAGQIKAVTIATNMAGRGTDIVLGEGVKDAGGLFVIGSERHESRRIDNQLRGRSGRQGDPGKSKFFVALDDELMRLFGSDRITKVMNTLGMPDDMPIEHKMITNSIQRAQQKVEKYHFGIRKQILEYDDVINKQRETIYGLRFRILSCDRLNELVKDHVVELVTTYMGDKTVKELSVQDEKDALKQFLKRLFPVQNMDDIVNEAIKSSDFKMTLVGYLYQLYEQKVSAHPEHLFEQLVTKRILLTNLDRKWMDHLYNMDILREGIGLRAWGQRDPLMEYKREAFDMFKDLIFSIAEESILMINRAVLVPKEDMELSPVQLDKIQTNKEKKSVEQRLVKKVGRNEKVNLQKDGVQKVVKWKHAEQLLTEGWQLVT